jgi:hypothetical protein
MMAGGAAAMIAPGLLSPGPASSPLRAQERIRGGAIPRDPAMAAAAPPVRLGNTIFTADDPDALWQQAGQHTVRVFLRKGPWALIWYLQAASPVDGKPFDVVVVERQRWSNLAAETPAVSYQASVFGRSFPLYGHGDFQRWVVASRAWPVSDRELNRWQASGLLLPWGFGPRLQAPSQWPYMDPVPDYTPLDKGGLTPAMGTTGLRDEVGPIIHRQARYIQERSAEMRRLTMNYGLTAASIPWHVRGADGLPLLLDTPNIPLKVQQYYQNYPEERIIGVSPGMRFDWDIDNAHRPCPAFIPALLSELHPFFVEEQVFSACTVLNTVTPDYRGASGKLIDQDQGRDWAWSMRGLCRRLTGCRPQTGLMRSCRPTSTARSGRLQCRGWGNWGCSGKAMPGTASPIRPSGRRSGRGSDPASTRAQSSTTLVTCWIGGGDCIPIRAGPNCRLSLQRGFWRGGFLRPGLTVSSICQRDWRAAGSAIGGKWHRFLACLPILRGNHGFVLICRWMIRARIPTPPNIPRQSIMA